MKKTFILAAAAAMFLSLGVQAQDKPAQIKWYGFIRNYLSFDTRVSTAGTEDFFYYLPYDESINSNEDDVNQQYSMSYAALTSRLGVDVTGYEVDGWKIGAKIETDFYSGVSGVTGTATLRLRQAFVTLAKNDVALKLGQAWHPMAADIPDVYSLNTGAPFGPFSRTPLATFTYKFDDEFSLDFSAIWQMQYTSNGPEGSSANYMKYSCVPELYLGLNYKSDKFLARVGLDMLSIKPRRVDSEGSKVSDRLTTLSPFIYIQYVDGLFSLKAKSIYASAGEHMNLNGGYGISKVKSDGSYEYAATHNSSSWVQLRYGKKFVGNLFLGYVKNFGTSKEVQNLYFSKNSFSNMNQMFRISPSLGYNLGKFTVSLEYEVTSVQYGDANGELKDGLYKDDLHWVTNNRLLLMTKFAF